MTTIAWDGKTLAVDSFGTRGNTIVSQRTKKLFVDVGPFKAVAFSGTFQDCQPLLKWIKEGGDNPSLGESFNIVCISKKGKCITLHDGDSLFFVEEEGLWTSGSGQNIALGALDAGATAIEAVKIACKRDIYTGGKVQSYTFEG